MTDEAAKPNPETPAPGGEAPAPNPPTEQPKADPPTAAAPSEAPAEAPAKEEPPKEGPTSLVGDAAGKAKPAEAKAEEPKAEAKAGEEPKAEEPAPAEPAPKNFTYEPFTVPEGIELDPARVTDLQAILTEAAPSQEIAQATGQKLVDLFINEVKNVQTAQTKAWEDTNKAWVEQVRADPEIGGNRIETVLQAVGGLVNQYGGDEAQRAELREVLNYTGAGNHPAMIRFLNRVAVALGEGRPIPAPTPTPKPATRGERRYGTAKT